MNMLEAIHQLQLEIDTRRGQDPRLMDPLMLMGSLSEAGGAISILMTVIESADVLATHVSGLLDLKLVNIPETTRHWLENYLRARAALDEETK